MSANSVTWGGVTLVGDSSGSWTLTPGTFGLRREFAGLARVRGAVAKDFGSDGAEHVLEVVYHLANTAALVALQGTLDSLTFPVGWDGAMKTLTATDPAGATMFTAGWCVLASVEPERPERRTSNHWSTDVRWERAVKFTFVQVRR